MGRKKWGDIVTCENQIGCFGAFGNEDGSIPFFHGGQSGELKPIEETHMLSSVQAMLSGTPSPLGSVAGFIVAGCGLWTNLSALKYNIEQCLLTDTCKITVQRNCK